jgi:hypothetical protein
VPDHGRVDQDKRRLGGQHHERRGGQPQHAGRAHPSGRTGRRRHRSRRGGVLARRVSW